VRGLFGLSFRMRVVVAWNWRYLLRVREKFLRSMAP
jgi:hypothetical protein